MDRFKHDRFARDHPEHSSPILEALTASEATALRERVAIRLGLAKDSDPVMLVKAVSSRSIPIKQLDAKSDDFKLEQAFWTARLTPPPYVFVNWYRFDQVDRGNVRELSQFFRDVWYPESDDIDLFDETCDWIMSVTHAGVVSLAKFGTAPLTRAGR